MSNPLLHIEGLPPFSQIKPEHIQPAIEKLIEENRYSNTYTKSAFFKSNIFIILIFKILMVII